MAFPIKFIDLVGSRISKKHGDTYVSGIVADLKWSDQMFKNLSTNEVCRGICIKLRPEDKDPFWTLPVPSEEWVPENQESLTTATT